MTAIKSTSLHRFDTQSKGSLGAKSWRTYLTILWEASKEDTVGWDIESQVNLESGKLRWLQDASALWVHSWVSLSILTQVGGGLNRLTSEVSYAAQRRPPGLYSFLALQQQLTMCWWWLCHLSWANCYGLFCEYYELWEVMLFHCGEELRAGVFDRVGFTLFT